MRKYAVIVAGGAGTRMGSAVPKQFMLLNGRPVLLHTIEVFLRAYNDLQIILVLPALFEEYGRKLMLQATAASRVQMVLGGATRFHSVQNGLKKINETSIVFVHDGVRCLVSEALIRRCYEQTLIKGNAIPAVAVNDSIRMVEGNKTKVVDRSKLLAVQTPQTFRSNIILSAFEQSYNEGFTDEATVAEAAGHEIFMIEGEKENIKITLPADLLIAEQLSRKA